ncbi:F0F1 ATP synthase subunit gamma [Methylobacter sp.]|uniref:F0F1 ATP synthase subunit gamma n=1 Tax=Methylobacter sp. TaxID=2051955 RepID=UPI0011FC9887|nr:F0F1 ATP synthase subunit gamma [Methylobacter sp.]TAK64742.1 MAG: F0F1 ATP synthase subunit gamma [Methylobacter sp.]
MSLSRELQLHITQLKDIRSILNSMKNLAFIEIHKLQRFKTMQSQVVANIERAALDFLDFYPGLAAVENNAAHICVLLGAERGFCGDFNESLINAISSQAYTGIIAVGSRLANRLEGISPEIIATLEGANIAEEVPEIINRLLDAINALPEVAAIDKTASILQLTVVYHHDSTNQIDHRQVLPPFPQQNKRTFHYGNPPVLNLEPGVFFTDLVDHYLFAVLHEIFYTSLLAENHRRQQHLEGAVNHLDDETVKLQRKSQIYRQEEITEEIEVILLNAENL